MNCCKKFTLCNIFLNLLGNVFPGTHTQTNLNHSQRFTNRLHKSPTCLDKSGQQVGLGDFMENYCYNNPNNFKRVKMGRPIKKLKKFAIRAVKQILLKVI